MQLSEEQKRNIKQYIENYLKWLQSDEALEWKLGHKERIENYGRLLKKDEIDKLTEFDVGNILSDLYATRVWTSKDYFLKQFFKKNEFNQFKIELKNLLWGQESVEVRYDRFREKVKHLGPAAITEILSFVHPSSCGIWNERVKSAFEILKLEVLIPFKGKFSGKVYAAINQVIGLVQKELDVSGIKDHDLLATDLFMYFVYSHTERVDIKQVSLEENAEYDFDHYEVIEKIVEIGTGLGFDADSEVPIAKGARADAVWTARIGNLGSIKYVFEVQRGGNVDSLIVNLQKAKNMPQVQKLVIVANGKTLETIRQEVSALSVDFTKSLIYMEVKDIDRSAALLAELNTMLSKLELGRTHV